MPSDEAQDEQRGVDAGGVARRRGAERGSWPWGSFWMSFEQAGSGRLRARIARPARDRDVARQAGCG